MEQAESRFRGLLLLNEITGLRLPLRPKHNLYSLLVIVWLLADSYIKVQQPEPHSVGLGSSRR